MTTRDIIFVLILHAFLLLLGILRLKKWRDRRRRATRPEAMLRRKPPEPGERARARKFVVGWVLFLSLAVVFFILLNKRGGGAATPPGGTQGSALFPIRGAGIILWGLGVLFLALLSLIAAAFLIGFLREDPLLRRAVKLSRAGRVAEAIALVRERIADKGETWQRCQVLGGLLLVAEKYPEALEQLDRAERLTGNPHSMLLNNRAIALSKLGRLDGALATMATLCAKDPRNWEWRCNHADLLAAAGQVEQAHDELDRAEALLDELPWAPAGWRQRLGGIRGKLPAAHGFPLVARSGDASA